VIGVVIGTALLGGCSEKHEANDTLPSPSAAETTEALPALGPADFPVPDEARTKDAAGAEAFLRYWIDLMNRQRAVPDGQPLRDLAPDCQECLRIARLYDDAASVGNRYEGGELTLSDVPAPELTDERAVVNFAVQREAVALTDSSGAVLDELPMGANVLSGASLLWSDSEKTWVVESFNIG
jgi:hypothetical protein